jgi:hypothetical protein
MVKGEEKMRIGRRDEGGGKVRAFLAFAGFLVIACWARIRPKGHF